MTTIEKSHPKDSHVVDQLLKLEETIRGELAAEKKKDPANYLDNFIMNLPLLNEHSPSLNNYRRMVVHLQNKDEMFSRIYESAKDRHTISGTKLRQTPRQFFHLIDRALEETGVHMDQLKHLLSEYTEQKSQEGKFPSEERLIENRELKKIIYSLVEDAYVRLRIEYGYSKADLMR